MDSESESETLTPPSVLEKALDAEKVLIPEKSHDKYENAYNLFEKWREINNCKRSFSESTFLAYLSDKSKVWKPSTLWAQYSMLRSMVNINHSIDIRSYKKVIAFLKNTSKGFRSKKAKVFTSEEVNKFLTEAPDSQYLVAKVIMIFGITGACRSSELKDITVQDIEPQGDIYLVQIPKTKTSIPRSFTITKEFAIIVKKYATLRPSHAVTTRFFLNYQNGKCSVQVIGINKFSKTPQTIAEYLKLENPQLYTGHSFRRTSATLLVDAGADITTLKRHGGWKSNTVAEGYVDNSIANKKRIAEQISSSVGLTISSVNSKRAKLSSDDHAIPSTSTIQLQNLSNEEIKVPLNPGTTIQMTNCSNFNIKFEKDN